MGDHRLLCGDSTKAEVLWTDPPYGVDYTGKTANALKIENDLSSNTAALLSSTYRGA